MNKRVVKEYFWITIGYLILSVAIKFFFVPNKIAGGGVTGIAIIINHYIPQMSVGMLILVMNIILFIIALIVLGGNFGAKTIYASLALSGSIIVMDKFISPEVAATNDLLLATVFGTLLSGIGMAIVFNQNASTGGTDIIAKILNKFVHLDIGKALLAVDFMVVSASALTFNAEIGMYAFLAAIMNGFVIDYVIAGLNKCKAIVVISIKYELVNEFIIRELDRGCTIIEGKGGYSGKETKMIYTVLGRKEFIKLREYIKDIDRKAFITVSDAHEVLGEGFKDIIES